MEAASLRISMIFRFTWLASASAVLFYAHSLLIAAMRQLMDVL